MEKSAEKQTAGFLFNSQQTDHDKVRTAKNSALLPDTTIESVIAIRDGRQKTVFDLFRKTLSHEKKFSSEKKLSCEKKFPSEKKLSCDKKFSCEKKLYPENKLSCEKKLSHEKRLSCEKRLFPEKKLLPEKKLSREKVKRSDGL